MDKLWYDYTGKQVKLQLNVEVSGILSNQYIGFRRFTFGVEGELNSLTPSFQCLAVVLGQEL